MRHDHIPLGHDAIGGQLNVRKGREEYLQALGKRGVAGGVRPKAPVMDLARSKQFDHDIGPASMPDLLPVSLHEGFVLIGCRRGTRRCPGRCAKGCLFRGGRSLSEAGHGHCVAAARRKEGKQQHEIRKAS